MKLKSILLLMSSISLLAGCNKVSSNSDTLTPDTNTGEIDTGSQDTNTPSTSVDTDSTDTGTDTGSIDTTPVEENQTYTTPTDFISSNGFKGGNQFDNMSDGATKLKNALDPEGIIIQSVVTSNITIQFRRSISYTYNKICSIFSNIYSRLFKGGILWLNNIIFAII